MYLSGLAATGFLSMNDILLPSSIKWLKCQCFYYIKNAVKKVLPNTKITVYPLGIYLLKIKNKNFSVRSVNWSKLTKNTPERPHWHRDIKKCWHHSGVFTFSFEKIPYLFSAFHHWVWGMLLSGFTNTNTIKVQTSKNYKTCKDRCKSYHINQMDQTTIWKGNCIKFKN